MSNLEEKILNGSRVHYIEAGDDDKRIEDETGNETTSNQHQPSNLESSINLKYESISSSLDDQPRLRRSETLNFCSYNTGPKGVIQDFKHHVTQKDRHPNIAASDADPLELEFEQLMSDDSILEQFKQERLKRLNNADRNIPEFGYMKHISSGEEFLKNVDDENPNATVVCHVYRKFSQMCLILNKHLEEISKKYKHIKFMCIDAAVVGLSTNFIENGVPALLVYKNGNLVKSLVRLEDNFDRDFDLNQVKELLVENNVI